MIYSRAAGNWSSIARSSSADQVSHLAHLNARGTTLAWASRAPQADIARLKARMGWEMPWYTITDSFDKDFGVDEWCGHNVFVRDRERVFRTYFINARGGEAMGTTWSYLDITPLGRQETWGGLNRGLPPERAVQVVELARRGFWTELCALFNAQSLDGVDGCGAASGDHTRNASGDNQNDDSYRHDA